MLSSGQGKVHVIVVAYKQPTLEKRCIESVKRYTFPSFYRLTVIDNAAKNEPLSVIWNREIKDQPEEFFCLLNSDTITEDAWLEKLVTSLQQHPSAGLIGPSTNHCAGVQQQGRGNAVIVPPHLVGFCLVGRKIAWKAVDGFDEEAPFYGQDTDFVRRVRAAGIGLLWDKSVFIHHDHGGTAHKVWDTKEYARQRDLGRQYIGKKHGQVRSK